MPLMPKDALNTAVASHRSRGFIFWGCHGNHGGGRHLSGGCGMMRNSSLTKSPFATLICVIALPLIANKDKNMLINAFLVLQWRINETYGGYCEYT